MDKINSERDGLSCPSAEDRAFAEDAVYIALELGESILRCGGEIHRAEDTIDRICRAYGALDVDASAILSIIVVTAKFDDGVSVTSSRRLSEVGTNNLGNLAKLNELSRKTCREKPSREIFCKQLEKINSSSQISMKRFVLGSMLVAFAFAIFFNDYSGGITATVVLYRLLDGLLAAIVAFPLALIAKYFANTKMNAIIAKFVICFLGGFAALLLSSAIPQCNVNNIMIGNIMNFIPGVAMTNAFRDMFGGHVMSGVFRLCAAVIDAVAIAAGYAVAILIFGGVI